jgi:predicted membrane protein
MWTLENLAKVNEKELRKFALTLFIVLCILEGILFWKHGNVSLIPLLFGLTLLILGWSWPRSLKPFYRGWMTLAFALGFVSSHLLLALLYYLIITPTGFLLRLLGKDPLQKKPDQDAQTYWQKKNKKNLSKSQYEKMF